MRGVGLLAFASLVWLSASAENSTTSVDLFAEEIPDDFDVFGALDGLVAQMQQRLKCTQYGMNQVECDSCLRTEKILELLQIDPDERRISKKEVSDLSAIFLHHLVYFSSLCKSEPGGCSDFSSCRDTIYDQVRTGDLESVESILRHVDAVLEPGPVHECFTAENVLDEVDNSPYTNNDEKVGQIILVLMKHVSKGHCIDVEESLTDFIDDIFYLYGERCSSVIDVNGLKRIMHDLQSNGAHDHEGHDHDEHYHQEKHGHAHHHHEDEDDDHSHHHHHDEDCTHHVNNFAHTKPDHPHSLKYEHTFHEHTEPIPDHDDHYSRPNDHSEDHGDATSQTSPHANHKRVKPPVTNPVNLDNITHPELDTSNGTKDLNPDDGSYKSSESPEEKFALTQIISSSDNTISATATSGSTTEPYSTMNDSLILEFSSDFTTVAVDETRDSLANSSTLTNHDTDVLVPNVSSSEKSFETVPEKDLFERLKSYENFENLNVPVSEPAEVRSQANDRPPPVQPESDFAVASALKSELFHQAENNGGGNSIHTHHGNNLHGFELESEEMVTGMEPLLEHEGNLHQHVSLASKCLSAEDLVARFGRVSNSSLTKLEFMQLCPALVQQIVSGVCRSKVVVPQKQPTKWELYGYSTLAVLVISLTSLAGVVLLPILAKQAYYYVMAGCIGLAFSTLAGDAFLHLIPQALGLHSHGGEDDSHGHGHDHGSSVDPSMWKQLGVFAAVYFLYLFEAAICVFSKKNQHSHVHGHGHSHIPDSLPKELTLVSIKVKSDSNTQLAMTPERSTSLDTEIADIEVIKKPTVVLSTPSLCGLSTVALLITLGDGIHNFGDGLAIGAAFSSGLRSGLSTSIAVFCHELPHEFGDFVILISSGLSFGKALWLNFLTGLTCLIGLYIGIQLGVNETARSYILAITAGIFLYVALTEMLPQLKENKKGNPVKMLFVKNLGILLGITIMVLMSVYEHHFYL